MLLLFQATAWRFAMGYFVTWTGHCAAANDGFITRSGTAPTETDFGLGAEGFEFLATPNCK
jgi:hypothetical protein